MAWLIRRMGPHLQAFARDRKRLEERRVAVTAALTERLLTDGKCVKRVNTVNRLLRPF
jgi:hypothetical protein